jgi:urease accessory protein
MSLGLRLVIAGGSLPLVPGTALAHAPLGGPETFASALLHPLLVPAHLIAVAALALLAGQHDPSSRRTLARAYAGGLVLGFAAMVAAFATQLSGEAVLAGTALAGGAVALARPLPWPAAAALASATGFALAMDSPPNVIRVEEANLLLVGTFCGATLLFSIIAAASSGLSRPWQRTGVRILGSWIAAAALMVLAFRLTG